MSATEKSCLYRRRMNVYFTDAQQAGEQQHIVRYLMLLCIALLHTHTLALCVCV